MPGVCGVVGVPVVIPVEETRSGLGNVSKETVPQEILSVLEIVQKASIVTLIKVACKTIVYCSN